MSDLESQLAASGKRPEMFEAVEAVAVDPARFAENLRVVQVELDAPSESRLARLLRRVGVPDLAVPLVTATPALRRSWFVALAVTILFAVTTAGNSTGEGVDRIVVFLTAAPLLALLGVALAFGRGVDPTHDLVVAAPRDTFTVFLVRALTVLMVSAGLLLVASLLLSDGGFFRVAWLLPAIAIVALTMALSIGRDPRRVAVGVAVGWLLVVVVVSSASSVAAMFGIVTQLVAVVSMVGAAWLLARRRGRFEFMKVDS